MVEHTAEYRRTRRAYELGRLRASTWRALAVSAPLALGGWLVAGRASLAWLSVTLLVWLLAFWRGGAVLRGAFHGLLGGLVTFVLPMSILRPCCAPGAMMNTADCCTMPGACFAAGGVVGVLLAALVPLRRDAWWQTATGMVMGVASVAILKCATLFAGEALGLVGGIAAGLMAASAAKAMVARRSVA
jgi:hypothetical protein